MVTDERKDKIAEQLVLKYDYTTEEANETVTAYIEEKPDDIDDELDDEQAADLINEYSD